MEFQSTHSLRSATEYATGLPASSRSFNPRTPCGVRRLIVHGRLFYTGFQSTHSLRSATVSAKSTRERMPVSIHALLAECDYNPADIDTFLETVSIHALLAECDTYPSGEVEMTKVSIHALLAECDLFCGQSCAVSDGFNPRTPCGVRRACASSHCSHATGFNPRTPCGVRPQDCPPHKLTRLFQSTHSLRSATSCTGI